MQTESLFWQHIIVTYYVQQKNLLEILILFVEYNFIDFANYFVKSILF